MSSVVEVRIAPMRRRNLKRVVAIETLINPKPWTLAIFQSELALVETRTYLVAFVGREVVGFGGLMLAVDDGHITSIGVDPAWQRRGIARQLMIALARAARRRNATALTLEVRLSNRGAQSLYRRFGFAPVGARKDYYQAPLEDALIMWAHDVATDEYAELLRSNERQLGFAVVVDGAQLVVSTPLDDANADTDDELESQ